MYEWERVCENAKAHGAPGGRVIGELAVDAAMDVLQMARVLSGDFCDRCGGRGERAYSDTSTWGGGVGGQAMTVGTCDLCWGTGLGSRKGPDLRRVSAVMRRLAADGAK